MNVGEPDGSIVATWVQKQPRHAPIGSGSGEPDDDGDDTLYLHGVQHAFHDLPQEQPADCHKANRIEYVGASQQLLGRTVGDNECQIDTDQRQFVREVVQTIHDEAQARRLIARDPFDDADAGVESDCSGDWLSMMSHANNLPN